MFSCKAHVFQLEPELKKSWIALSTTAVNVQIFHDPIKSIYRIVSVEGTKALINSIVTPRMTFTKTSQKFGQWIDFKLNLVYGLGFSNDIELNKFVDKFKEIKEMTRSNTNTFLRPHERSNSCEITSMNRMGLGSSALHTNANVHLFNSGNTNGEHISSSTSPQTTAEQTVDLLRSDNERLKQALAQQSHQTRKLEEEMQTFKQQNARLTQALQESPEEIKKQLQYYKDECNRLSTRLSKTNGNNNNNNAMTNSDMSDNYNSNNNNHNNGSSKLLKQEMVRLCDAFDKKLNELTEIRQQLKSLCNSDC